MKKYLFIVLLVGAVFGQAVPDTLTLRNGRIINGTFIKQGEFFTEFKNWKDNEVSEIRNLKINKIVLGNGDIIYERKIPKVKIKSASENFEMAGKHLQNSLIRNIYSVGLFIAGNYLAIEAFKNDEPNILIPLLYAGAIYNGIYATLEIYRCSDSLIKASQKISDIEKSLDIKIEN